MKRSYKQQILILSLLAVFLVSVSCSKKQNETQQINYDDRINILVETYFDAIENCDFVQYSACYPDFYNHAYSNFALSYGYESAEILFIESDYSYYVTTGGSNFDIKASINSIEEMSADELKTGTDAIIQTFGLNSLNMTRAFNINITEDVSGNSGNENETYDMIVIEIDGNLYLYDQYFEYLSTMWYE